MALQLRTPAGRGVGSSSESLSFISDYNDFLPGVSMKKFYYGDDHTDTTTKKLLQENGWKVNLGNTTINTIKVSGASFTKEIDIDFDITIEGERLIGGDCLAQVKFDTFEGASSEVVAFPIVKVVHYDGTTETVLATMQGKEENSVSASKEFTHSLKGTVTKKNFKKGDILRITIEIWAKEDMDEVDNAVYLFHDGGLVNETGDSFIYIPFIRLDEY